jgi:hypothetical protein
MVFATLVGTGPRFLLRSDRTSERQLAPSRISKWVTGGAPAPPENLTVRPAGPQAPHLVPPRERLAMRPSSGAR